MAATGREVPDPNRREFLAHVGGAAATVAGAATLAPEAAAHEREERRDRESRAGRQRANEAFEVRVRAARFQREEGEGVRHLTNGDERRYANLIGSFSKTLPHDANGIADRAAFMALVHAMETADPDDFELIPMGGAARLANPQAGFAFGFAGADPFATTMPAAPDFASAEIAAEMVELYWAALTRDVRFDMFDSDPTIAAAAAELSTLSNFRGPKSAGKVTPGTIFRGPTAGERVGPYLSQLLWKPVNYGPYVVDQRVRIAAEGIDFLTDYHQWLDVQNGVIPSQPPTPSTRRYIITGRDLTEWLHRDFSHQGGTNAVFILAASGVGLAAGNPYLDSATQSGNFTLGTSQILDLVASIANLSLQACWYHKWSVHRRVRPEEFGGSVHHERGPIHRQVLNSDALARVRSKSGTGLLPMPYAEGCPLHPAYPAGHATFAGAWCTILKAFFNTEAPMTGTVVPNADGTDLVPYSGPALTAGNEIDKLASNVAMGRITCGVHWRSDSLQGMLLGEHCAIAVLQDMRRTWNESFDGFRFKKFDGTTVRI
jgi:hypothetical protein